VYIIKIRAENNHFVAVSLQNLPNLVTLYLSQNQLTSLNVAGSNNIQYLYADNNRLTTFTAENLSGLREFELSFNHLTTLYFKNGSDEADYLAFSDNPNLTYICCDAGQQAIVQTLATQYGNTNCTIDAACTVATQQLAIGNSAAILYPNPVKDILYIQANSPISSVIIYDMMGNILQNTTTNTNENTITLPNLSSIMRVTGIYIVIVNTETGIFTKKIFKE
jgi:Leucine-rich repeat (LRR) protein